MSHLDALNERQKEAVLHTDGPLLVLAGAGSGKTRVIVHRILHLIESGIDPESILAVTFTNKAAKEMRSRVTEEIQRQQLYDAREKLPMIATFHSLGVRILREHHDTLGLKRHFTIYDRSDSIRAMKQALTQAGYNPKQFEPKRVLSVISRAKGNALSQSAFAEQAHSYPEQVTAEVWQRYEKILRSEHALDFDDLLLTTLELFTAHVDILKKYQEHYSHIHIDEYQDTNTVQYEIARALAGDTANICAVGDVDQNIYSWRGADIHNILQFERHFKNASVIPLEENYRSTQTIITASNAVIAKNANRIPKEVFTNNHVGEPLSLYASTDETDEARYVVETAAKLIRDGASPSAIAVLFRANYQSRALEDAFLSHNVPYQVLGVRFFQRKEVKDVLSFLRLAVLEENSVDLSRIINVPPRGIGKVTLLKLIEGKRDTLTGTIAKRVEEFDLMMKEIATATKTRPLSKTIAFILARTGLEATLKEDGEEGLERLENLRELVSLGARYNGYTPEEGLERFLEDVALQSDQDELDTDAAAVRLMTIHAAKGLEFPYVFITGLEEGLFPHERLTNETIDHEEERRLFYVALTRAQKKVLLSYAQMRTVFGSRRLNEPSSFLADIDNIQREYGYDTTTPEAIIEID